MKRTLLLLFIIMGVLSCNNSKKGLVINGRIENAEKKVIYVSSLGAQNVEMLDSVKLGSNGKFSFELAASQYPEFYFIKIGGKTITLLADSTKKITLESELPDLLENAKISGSEESNLILKVDEKLGALRLDYQRYRKAWDDIEEPEEKQKAVDDIVEKINNYKEDVGQMIMESPRSFFGYYVLYQKLDDSYALFNPYDEKDFKYYGALATSLNIFYPDAPRTKALYAKVEDAIRLQRSARFEALIADAEEGLPDIASPDVKGDTVRLSSLKGKVVLLNYWASSNEPSRVMNRIISNLYKKYKYRGFEVYQCSLDKSKVRWEMAIEEDGVKWITVCDLKGPNSSSVWSYNVQELPTNYLIDRNGDIVGKFNDPIELEKKLKALL